MNPPPIVWILGAGVLAGVGWSLWSDSGGSVPPSRPGQFFTWGELTRSGEASRLGIANTPTADHYRRLGLLTARILDPLRVALGRPVSVTSGYRSVELNKAIGGADSSQHMVGEAVDLKVEGYPAIDLARRIHDLGLPYDQLIWYAPERGGHVHVSHAADRPQRGDLRYAPVQGGYPSFSFGVTYA